MPFFSLSLVAALMVVITVLTGHFPCCLMRDKASHSCSCFSSCRLLPWAAARDGQEQPEVGQGCLRKPAPHSKGGVEINPGALHLGTSNSAEGSCKKCCLQFQTSRTNLSMILCIHMLLFFLQSACNALLYFVVC